MWFLNRIKTMIQNVTIGWDNGIELEKNQKARKVKESGKQEYQIFKYKGK